MCPTIVSVTFLDMSDDMTYHITEVTDVTVVEVVTVVTEVTDVKVIEVVTVVIEVTDVTVV